jgi:prepilin-type N-terminal cleavage/methylation domain-containing protein
MFGKVKFKRQLGLTLPEMLFTLSIGALLGAAVLSFSLYAGKSFAALTNYVDLEQKSQNALDNLTREVRQVNKVLSYGTMSWHGQTITNTLTFEDSDGQPLTYTFTNQVLVRSKSGVDRVVLTNCDYLTFQVFQRNPVGGVWDQWTTTVATNTKLISVSWVCSRNILGNRMNTESVQTAKVVIRKE